MRRLRDRRVVFGSLLALLATLLVGLALAQAFRDTTAPSLWIEAPARVAAGDAFELLISADEPATYRVGYGAQIIERVEQDLHLTLTAAAGAVPLRVTATDAAGNAGTASRTVEGVVVPRAELELPAELRPGDPFTATVRFTPADAPRSDVVLRGGPVGDEAAMIGRAQDDGVYAIGVVPLGTEPGPFRLEARWRDGLERDAAGSATTRVVPLGQEVEELQISAAVLSVITPEGRLLEQEALASVVADPSEAPRWSEPFIAPIEGRGTSGFGSPRRYAPGGPVSFHLGEDIAAPAGTPIHATNAGVVVLAGHYPIKGGLTIIDHGAGVTSRYFHQSSIAVEAGQRVARGQVIGEVGSTGLSTGPHLHWEMWVGQEASYPMAWVDALKP